jgi:hypothetical protein
MKQELWPPWEYGVSPYDALAPAGITPDSTQRDLQDASYTLIEQGLWTPERRAAWDELRRVEGRLWVDFFLPSMLGNAQEMARLELIADFDERPDAILETLSFDT